MKAVLAAALAAMLVSSLRADWKDLKPGMDQSAVWQSVGAPLIQNNGRGISAVWTYDEGGYVMFEGGRAVFWARPKPAQPDQRHDLPIAKPQAKTGKRPVSDKLLAKS